MQIENTNLDASVFERQVSKKAEDNYRLFLKHYTHDGQYSANEKITFISDGMSDTCWLTFGVDKSFGKDKQKPSAEQLSQISAFANFMVGAGMAKHGQKMSDSPKVSSQSYAAATDKPIISIEFQCPQDMVLCFNAAAGALKGETIDLPEQQSKSLLR